MTKTPYIQPEIELFDKFYFKEIQSNVELIDKVLKYLCKQKGKLLRPKLSLFTAKILGKVNEKTYTAASLVEMIHVATLIHDDIVDESDLRRGWPTIGRIWKNKISILIGDYLFSKALSTTAKLDDIESIYILSKTSDQLSKGEVFQIQQSRKKYMSENNYYKMIEDKTASLFSATCELSARTVTKNDRDIKMFKDFGRNFGMAYQIKDDINDIFGKEENLGKPSNFDLKKNILTLPFIHCLNNLSKSNRSKFLTKIKALSKRNKASEIQLLVKEHKGLEYANKVLDSYLQKAREAVSSFSNSKELTSFVNQIFYE